MQYDGEYVLTADGRQDFGEIPPEVARTIKHQAGKIRLRIGYHNDNDSSGNYGQAHIERAGRLKQLQNAGFDNARDFVSYVCENYNAIYAGDGRSLRLCASGKKDCVIFVRLEPCGDGDFYDVKTGMLARKSYLRNEAPLWSRP